jgi:DNA polymerase-3 subunit beta
MMKALVSLPTLQKKLHFLQHAISAKSQLPVLLYVHLEVLKETVFLRATDLEIGIETTITATDTEEGSVAVPAKPFIELINTLTQDKALLITNENTLTLQTEKTKSLFQTMSGNEFPRLYHEKGEKGATFLPEKIKNDVVRVVFAASTDVTRASLSGVLLTTNEDKVLLVATDGYRLSLSRNSNVKLYTQVKEGIIVPARLMREIMFLDDGEEVMMYIAKEQNQLVFEQKETKLIGRLIDASFPNYQKILPTEAASSTSFIREELLRAVRRCSIFARDAANIVKLSLTKDGLIVSSRAASLGENATEVEATLKGEENEIAFNARYVLDVLTNVDAEEMLFEMTGPLNPGVFKIKGEDSFLHLIMPIRLEG